YLIPAVAGILSKPPGLIFPLILLSYVWLFERGRTPLRATIPAFLVTAAAGILTVEMTPPTFGAGANSPALYIMTQPWVMLHYFKVFFIPTDLNVDAAWNYVSPFGVKALAGYLFVAAMVVGAVRTSRQRETRIISFGIIWFFLALLPTSLTPLTDVMNDHRMFFPFVGLALAAVWGLRLLLPAQLTAPRPHSALAAGLMIMLLAEAAGAYSRNNVWRTEESLWRDSTIKNPDNGRAWLGYGDAMYSRGDYVSAVSYLERALALAPYDANIEIALAKAYDATGRDSDAARHFQRAIGLAPGVWRTYAFYGGWLKDKGRLQESQAQLEAAVRMDADVVTAREMLMEVYVRQLNWPA